MAVSKLSRIFVVGALALSSLTLPAVSSPAAASEADRAGLASLLDGSPAPSGDPGIAFGTRTGPATALVGERPQRARIDPAVSEAAAKGDKVPVIVRLRDQVDLATAAAEARRAAAAGGKAARGTDVVDALRTKASRTQGGVRALLSDVRATAVRPFWIFNGFAASIPAAAVERIANHPDVASVALDAEVTLPETQPGQPRLPTWGLERVNAPEVWGDYGFTGEGVVVGVMDSGVDGGHPALADGYRGRDGDHKSSWFAATGEDYPTPGDGHGHGTHVTATIAGGPPGDVTGVAPDAEWIAAKIFRDSGSTSNSIIHAGFEWMLAPGGDPAKAPDVVNNSWGSSATYNTEFWEDVNAWVAAGIFPNFAAGNDGPGPVGSPGSFPQAFAVGATDINDQIAGFSSRGPATWGGVEYTKPQVSAPGVDIYSAWPRSLDPDGYHTISGTSMATPHVTGVVALLLDAQPDLSVDALREVLTSTARTAPHMGELPNNSFGSGIVDAEEAVVAARFSGTVSGTVRGPGGPAQATLSVAELDVSTTSDPTTGHYELRLREGTWPVRISAYGYVDRTVEVTVAANETQTLDVELAEAAVHRIVGTVRGPAGPLADAAVRVAGSPLATVFTDRNGRYALDVAAGSYQISAEFTGYQRKTSQVTVDSDRTVEFVLSPLAADTLLQWREYQNNPRRSGMSAEQLSPEALTQRWQVDLSGQVMFSSPVIADGRVYLATEGGRLYAVNAADGATRWTFTAGAHFRTTPAVSDGRIYFGGGDSGVFHALDAATGQPIWSYPTGDRLTYTTPTVVAGTVYFGTGWGEGDGGWIYALDAATGALRWRTFIGAQVFFAPTVAAGTVFAGSYDARRLVALDAATGAEKWALTREQDSFAAIPTYADGVVYVGTNNFDTGAGSILAVDAATGAVRWEATGHGDASGAAPLVHGDLIIAGSNQNNWVAAYDRATGARRWVNPVGSAVSNAQLAADGVVLGGSQLDHRAWALDAYTGKLRWDVELADNVLSAPAYADGKLVLAARDGQLTMFEAPGAVSGVVRDADGKPLGGTVRDPETGESTTIDPATGRYTLSHDPGTFDIEIASYGYRTHRTEVTLRSGRTVTVDATLSRAGTGSLTGVVTDAAGTPMAGVSVGLADTPVPAVTTDEAGRYTFDEVAEGTFQVTADRDGYVPFSAPVTINVDEQTRRDITLEKYQVAVTGDYEGAVAKLLTDAGYTVESTTLAAIADRPGDYQLVVANGAYDDPGAEVFTRFVANADTAGTSVVFLDTWGINYGSLLHLSEYTGDPAEVDSGYSDGEVSVIARADHPLTAGLTPGKRVPILEPNYEHAWFSGYSGQSVADLYVGEVGVAGSVIGYQPRGHGSVHVLLGAHGVSPFVGPDEGWLPAARDIFHNAVRYALDASFGTVTGQVTDVATGVGLDARVTVAQTGAQASAGADGTYSLLLPAGDYTLRFERLGYSTREVAVTVPDRTTVTVDAGLAASGVGAIGGTVTSGGAPVAGAAVTVVGTQLTATSGPDGTYALSEVPGGTYQLRVTAAGYTTSTVNQVVVVDGAATDVDVTLRRAPRVAVVGDNRDVISNEITTFLNAHEMVATATGWAVLDQLDQYDVVLFNDPSDPGEETFRAALAKLDAAGVSGVFLQGPFSSDGGVRLLRKYLGNPTGQDFESSSGDPMLHPVDPNHPIFAGVDNPAQILLGDTLAGYFTGYTGIKLADFGTSEDGVVGVGAGYEPRTPTSVRLLLSGLGTSFFASPSDGWTTDGKRLFLNAVNWAAEPGLGALSAQVTGPAGEPVAGVRAKIVETGVSVTGDAGAAFTLAHPPGNYTLEVTAFGYQTQTRPVTFVAGQVDEADLTLALGPVGDILGLVTDRATGALLAGAKVTLDGVPRSAVTGTDGRFVLSNVTAGSYTVRAEAAGHVRQLFADVAVTAGADTALDLALRPSPKVAVIDDYQDRAKTYLADWGYLAEDLTWSDSDRIAGYDLILANSASYGDDPGAPTWAAFMAAVNRAEVPVVWLDQFGRGSIRWLSEYEGDPKVRGQGRSDGPVAVRVLADHPLVDGFDVGAQLPLVADGDEYSYFTGYSGVGVASLVTGEQGERGTAIAYRGRTAYSVDVLLSTLSISTYGYPPRGDEPGRSWTPNAEVLLHNALRFALDAPPLAAHVRGTVRGTADATPISGTVTVVETGRSVTSRADDGSYFVPLQPGTWTLKVSAFGHQEVTRTVTVSAGQAPTLDVTLTPQPSGQLSGQVTGEAGVPVAGAVLTLEGTPLSVTSAADGSYRFAQVPAGDYTLRVRADSYGMPRLPVTVTAGATTAVDVPLSPSRVVAVAGDSTSSVGDFLTDNGYAVQDWSWSEIDQHIGELGEVDLVVLNGSGIDPDADELVPFLDAAAKQSVSVIMVGQWGSGSIPTVHDVRNDPSITDDGFTEDGMGITYRPAEAHPIFAGFPTGEPILLMRNPNGYGQQWHWFDGYSGRTIASIGEENGAPLGGGVGYKFTSPRSVEVLLDGLAASSYGKPGERWTPAAERIYLNAVEWAMTAAQGEVTGQVTGTGKPVPGAEVHAVEADVRTTTGPDGSYRLGLPDGTHTIRVTAFGFEPFETQVTAKAGEIFVLPVALAPVPRGTVEGTVLDADGAPIANAEVTVRGPQQAGDLTDKAGNFRIDGLVPGEYTVTVAAKRYVTSTVTVTVVAEQTVSVPVAMVRNDVAVLGDVDGALTGFLQRNGVGAEEIGWAEAADVSAYRVVVVNGGDPSKAQFDALLNGADASATSLLFTGTWGVENGGIRLLERHGDGVVTVGRQGYRNGTVGLTGVDPAHPLFAGVDPAAILAPDSYWSDLSGYVGPYLAGLDVAGQAAGPDQAAVAVAYDFRTASSMHLLVSIGGVSELAGPGYGWTGATERLMLNAVVWAGDAVQPAPAAPVLDTGWLPTAAETVQLTGTGEFRSTVTVLRDGVAVATGAPGRDGRFTIEAPLVPGVNQFTATAANHAGDSAVSRRVTVIRDVNGPAVSWAPADRSGLFAPSTSVPVTGTVTDEYVAIGALEVNGVAVPVAADGTFATVIDLVEGENSITVVATDALGNTTTETRTVRLFPYRAGWKVFGEQGKGALNLQLALTDTAHAPVQADSVDLTLRDPAGQPVYQGPMSWEDGWYRGTVRGLGAGTYTAWVQLDVDGWQVLLPGGEVIHR